MWVVSNYVLARQFIQNTYLFVFAVLAASLLSVNYSPNAATFVLNECFPTARSIAFPLGLLALAFAANARVGVALLTATASMLLHPLIGVWVLATLIGTQQSNRILLLLVCACGALLVGLFGMEIGPFLRIDPDWESLARASSVDLFVGEWGRARMNSVLLALGLVLIAAECLPPAVRQLFQVAALIGGTGFLLAQIASYYVPSLLIIQAQTWRAMWISYALCVTACFVIASAAWQSKTHSAATVISLGICLLAPSAGYLSISIWAAFKLGGKSAALLWMRLAQRRPIYWRVLATCLALSFLPGLLVDIEAAGHSIPLSVQTGFTWFDGLVLAGGGGLGLALWAGIAVRWSRMFCLFSGVVFVVAIANWDQRSLVYAEWERTVSAGERPLGEWISGGEVVFWVGAAPQRVWGELGTANYASANQLIGGIFSRDKTFELLRRRQRLAVAAGATTGRLARTRQPCSSIVIRRRLDL